MRVTTHLLPLGVLLLSLFSPYRAEGKLQTVFVDDALGDSQTGALPTFLPSEGGFSQGPLCQGCGDAWCQGCNFQPDPAKAYGGTWKLATHFKNDPARYITFDFVGIEVEIFCILPNLPSSSSVVSRYSLDFRIDSEPPPNGQTVYDHVSDSSGTYQYNVSVFHQTGLTNEKHTMMVGATRSDIDVVLLFDYATYVFDDGITTPSRSSMTSTSSKSSPAPSKPSVTSTLTRKVKSSSVPPTTSPTPLDSSSSSLLGSSVPSSDIRSASAFPAFTTIPSAYPVFTTITTIPSSSHGNTPSTVIQSQQAPSHKPQHLAVILGSVFGALSAVLLGAFLVFYHRRRPRQSSDRSAIYPFSLQTPSIPKKWEKLSFLQNVSSSSSIPHFSPGEVEEEPPMYSQRGFQLTSFHQLIILPLSSNQTLWPIAVVKPLVSRPNRNRDPRSSFVQVFVYLGNCKLGRRTNHEEVDPGKIILNSSFWS